MFRAWMVEKEKGVSLQSVDEVALPEGDVLVAPQWSTLNYKDALALTGRGPVIRKWPMIPGIDGAGTVLESLHPDWKKGDRFVLNGWGVGEAHWGCFAEKARLRGEWLVHPPAALSTRQCMAIGTAGYTAMLCVQAIAAHGVKDGPVLVTGATGGVGSIAVSVLAKRGYEVHAVTGKANEQAYLEKLGARAVIARAELAEPGKPLQKEKWAAVVDVAGGHTLANACAQTRYNGIVVACGLAQSAEFTASVMPFILRAVRLQGVESVQVPLARRDAAWAALATDLDPALLELMTEEVAFADLQKTATRLLDGGVRGRVVTKVA